jgi:hypothetical protein
MRKLARLLATSLLVLSLSAVALADGGDTQGSNFVPPPAPPANSTTEIQSPSGASEQAASLDFAAGLEVFISVLSGSIF